MTVEIIQAIGDNIVSPIVLFGFFGWVIYLLVK